VSHAIAVDMCSTKVAKPVAGSSLPPPQISTGSTRPAFAKFPSSPGTSPTWSACRWERNSLVVDSTGSPSAVKFANDREPRSKRSSAPGTYVSGVG
jgi:hypothetical protein